MKDSYFQAYDDYFWEWETSSEEVVVSIPKSVTIAYRQHLFDIVEMLAPQGLPPFGSLLLAIAALHSGKAIDRVNEIFSSRLSTPDEPFLHAALDFLKLLNALPPQYKVAEKRVLLLQALFENCHNKISLRDSAAIAQWCKNGLHLFDQMANKKGFLAGVFRYDFRPIGILGSKFRSVEEIIEKIGVLPSTDQLIIDFEETPAPNVESHDLVDQLIANEKTFTTGSLVRWLWGGLNIPVHSALPSQQPLGGISDLTNKGDFDKLLISEFAYDDVTFLSRLANNEALYLHREIPPTSNDLNRVILIDASLKNWGTPKTIAFAVMLAIARHPKTDIACYVYVLGSEQYYAVAFETVHDIIDGLQIVEGGLHAAKSLATFFKDHGAERNKEIFLVTEATTVRHADMARAMSDHHDEINYVVFTDSNGTVDLFKRHQRARKHLQQIKLPLQQLWTRGSKKSGDRQAPDAHVHKDKSLAEIPILLKSPGAPKRIVTGPDGAIFQISNENSILRLFDKSSKDRKGWELLYLDVLKTPHFEIGFSESNEYVALLFDRQHKEISLINLGSGVKIVIKFDGWKSTDLLSFVFHSGKFYHVNHLKGWSISLDGTIAPSSDVQIPQVRQRKQELDEIVKGHVNHQSPFKNIHTVYINRSQKIVLNSAHELHVEKQTILLRPAHDLSVSEQAMKTGHSEFSFKDGSTMSVSRSGFMVLRSSDSHLLAIYVPLVLNKALGIATEESFAGNEYYFKERHHDNAALTSLSVPQERIAIEKFYALYIARYIKTITEYAV